jgi:hypothetical protein
MKTYWDVFKEKCEKVSSEYSRLVRKAEAAAEKTRRAVIDHAVETSTNQIKTQEELCRIAQQEIIPNAKFLVVYSQKKIVGSWHQFNEENGVWEEISTLKMREAVNAFLIKYDWAITKYRKPILEHLENVRRDNFNDYDPSHLLLIKDKKVLDSTTYTICDFDANIHKFTKCEQRTICDVDQYTAAIIDNLMNIVTRQKICKSYPFPFKKDESAWQKEKLKQLICNTFWGYQRDKVCVSLIGNPNSAKTILLNIFMNLLPNSTAVFDLTNVGDKGGMSTIYNKRIAIQNELNGGYLNKETCMKFKDLHSNVKNMSVRILYRDTFEYPINVSMWVASNQMPSLSAAFESDSTYKRFFFLYCPNFFTKCVELEDLIVDQEFLDKFFSYFIAMKPQSVIDNLEELILRSEQYYFHNSRPIERIVDAYYVRDYQNINGILTEDLYSMVEAAMTHLKMKIPKSLTEQINKAVERLGGILKRNRTVVLGETDDGVEIKTKGDYFIGISEKKIPHSASTSVSREDVKKLMEGDINAIEF